MSNLLSALSKRSFHKRSRLLIWWICSYLIVLVISIIFGTLIYFQTSKVLQEEITNANLLVLKQVCGGIDSRFEELKKTVFQLVLDKDIQDLGIIQDPMNNIQIYRMATIIDKLRIYSTSNDFITEIAIYYPKLNKVLNNNSNYYPDMYYQYGLPKYWNSYDEWLSNMDGIVASKLLTGKAFKSKNSDSAPLLYINPMGYDNNTSKGTILIKLDEEKILKSMNLVTLKPGVCMFITDRNNNLVFSQNNGIVSEIPDFTTFKVMGEGVRKIKINNEVYILSSITSKVNGWNYSVLSLRSTYMQRLEYITTVALKTTLFMLICCMAISIMLAYRNYQPVQRLVRFVSRLGVEKGRYQSEYSFIEKQFEKINSDNTHMSTVLKVQSIRLGKNYLYNLMRNVTNNESPVLDVLALYNIEFVHKNFIVFLIIFSENTSLFPTNELLEELPQTIEEYINEQIAESQAYCFYTDHMLSGVINFDEQSIQKLIYAINGLHKHLLEDHHLRLSIVVSDTHQSIYSISEAYTQAMHMYEKCLVNGNNRVLVYGEDTLNVTLDRIYYPQEMEPRIINNILAANIDQIMESLNKVFEENSKLNLSKRQLRFISYNLCTSLIKGITEACKVYGIEKEYFIEYTEQLIDCKDIESQYSLIQKVMSELCTAIAKTQKNNSNGLDKKVVEYVKANFHNPELNVYYIADKLAVNPAYLSRMFKEKTGEILSNFIAQYRIQQAEQLLLSGENVVNISNRVGFYNPNTFIRTFKKLRGITPGKYKEIKKNNGNE